jgi:hypothetical protein
VLLFASELTAPLNWEQTDSLLAYYQPEQESLAIESFAETSAPSEFQPRNTALVIPCLAGEVTGGG